MTVTNTDRTMQLYRDRFGFTFEGKPGFAADADLQALAGLKGGQVRHSVMVAPGERMTFELLEFKGLENTPLRSRIQDPGFGAHPGAEFVRSTKCSAMVTAMGSKAITTTDRPVGLPPNFYGVIVPDPTTSISR